MGRDARGAHGLMHELQLFTDLALLFTVAVGVALVLSRWKLPPVLAYLATGALLGPPGLGLVGHNEELLVVAEIGVVLLLFTVGLEFSLTELRRSWRAVILAGSMQVLGTIGVSTVVALLLGRTWQVGLTWGFLAAMSSTAVVLRILDSRGETKAAHGRLVVGVLIFQDLCIVPAMLLVPMLGGKGTSLGAGTASIKGILLVIGTLVLSQFGVPWLLRRVASVRNREMFLLAVLAVAGVTAYVTSTVGLSLALGAFLAGMVLADTDYAHQALAEVVPFRTVMMCVFFVTIGMLVDVDVVLARPVDVLLLVAGLVGGKFLVMWIAGMVLRFPVRVGALAAVALAQVGEFSFVLSGQAVQSGLLTADESRLFLAASVITIALAPLMMMLTPSLLAGSAALRPLERLLDGGIDVPEPIDVSNVRNHVIIAGLGVGGRAVLSALEESGIPAVIIELNPDTVRAERKAGRHVLYGDVSAPEVLEHAGIGLARAVCLVTSDRDATQQAVATIRMIRQDVPIILRCRFAREEDDARAPGVFVVSEEFAGAASIAGAVLRECGRDSWEDVLGDMLTEGAPDEREAP